MVEFAVKSSGPRPFGGTFKFYCWFSFIIWNWSVHIFLFSVSVLRNCTLLGICPFLLGCPLYRHVIGFSLLWSFYFFGVDYNCTVLILLIWASLSFSWWILQKWYPQFCILSQRISSSVSLIVSMVFWSLFHLFCSGSK